MWRDYDSDTSQQIENLLKTNQSQIYVQLKKIDTGEDAMYTIDVNKMQ